MKYIRYVSWAFFFVFLGSLFIINIPFNKFLITFFNNINVVLLFPIIMAALFPKKIIHGLKNLNLYSWLIIIFYILGTLMMEYKTYSYSINFIGIVSTSPLIVTFVYFSQKNNTLLLKERLLSKKDRFKMDLFLLTTSFLLAGCVLLIVQLDNSDFRSIWPFYLFFISFYGFLFSLIYAIICYFINKDHKKYTFFSASIVILLYSSISLFPKNVWFFNITRCEPFYALSILLLSLHCLVILSWFIKTRCSKIT